jgi:hypothetical protein
METKKCSMCGEEKSLECFGKCTGNKDGLKYSCSPCSREYNKRFKSNESPEQNSERCRKWRSKNREALRQYSHNRYHNNPQRRMYAILCRRMRQALKKASKSDSTMNLVGCDLDSLKLHLEQLFEDGMSWDNHGRPNGDFFAGWHVDHIRPCASFDLTNEEQQRVCFHYTNLQPLWAKDNMSKGDKWEEVESGFDEFRI